MLTTSRPMTPEVCDPMLLNLTYSERFWAKVDKSGDCWLWQGTKTKLGYGVVTEPAHRVSYRLTRGEVPVGMTLDHLCNNPSCVNPAHLEPVTQQENTRRRWLRTPTWSKDGTHYNSSKMYCPRGHDYTPENTYLRVKDNQRECRTCKREKWRELSPEKRARKR